MIQVLVFKVHTYKLGRKINNDSNLQRLFFDTHNMILSKNWDWQP